MIAPPVPDALLCTHPPRSGALCVWVGAATGETIVFRATPNERGVVRWVEICADPCVVAALCRCAAFDARELECAEEWRKFADVAQAGAMTRPDNVPDDDVSTTEAKA